MMDSDRWKQVDSVLQSVLDCPPEEVDAYLRHLCGNDETLEREVRSLLRAREQAGNFLESPAMEAAARALARQASGDDQQTITLSAGLTLSRYRIVGELGRGKNCHCFAAAVDPAVQQGLDAIRDPELVRGIAGGGRGKQAAGVRAGRCGASRRGGGRVS